MTCRRCGHGEELHSALAGCLAERCRCSSFELVTEGTEDGRGRRSQADHLAELGLGAEEIFSDPRDIAFATVRVDGHRECWPVQSRGFRRWLAGRFYEATGGKAPNAEAMKAALGILESRAHYGGAPKRSVYIRVAPDGSGGIYVDLGDPTWAAVHVTAHGWEIVADPPVAFRRPPGLGALPRPERGGDLEELRGLLNLGSDDDWALLRAWLVQAIHPSGPYPVLVLNGEQGSAKSTTARMLRDLVDPATPELRADPRELRDLMVAAENAWIIALDNISRIQPWLSDALCRLSTGGGWATRELYSDNEEVLFEAVRPVVLTGITEIVTRGDLLDRTIQLRLPPIPEHGRRREEDLWRAFAAARSRILSALLDRLAGALREMTSVHLDELPRMADFAYLAVAAERGAGEEPRFLAAYGAARAEADQAAVDGSPVGPALFRWLKAAPLPWEGTAAELLEALERAVGERDRPRGWPKTPRGLRAELDRLAPSLRRLGFSLSSERRGHGGPRILRIVPEEGGAEPSPPSPSPAGAASTCADGGDGLLGPDRHQPSPDRHQPSPDRHQPLGPLSCANAQRGDDGDDGDGLAAHFSEDGLPPPARAVLEVLRGAEGPLATPEIGRRAGLTWVEVDGLLRGPLAPYVRSSWDRGIQRFEAASTSAAGRPSADGGEPL